MTEPLYAIYHGPTHFATYPDARVPKQVRKVVTAGDLVLIYDANDGVCACELADGTVFRATFYHLTGLGFAKVGNEVSFKTPEIGYGNNVQAARMHTGTIIDVLRGRQFGHVLVLGDEENAYLVHINDLIKQE